MEKHVRVAAIHSNTISILFRKKKFTPGPLGPKKGPKRPFWGPRRKNHQNLSGKKYRVLIGGEEK